MTRKQEGPVERRDFSFFRERWRCFRLPARPDHFSNPAFLVFFQRLNPRALLRTGPRPAKLDLTGNLSYGPVKRQRQRDGFHRRSAKRPRSIRGEKPMNMTRRGVFATAGAAATALALPQR